MRDRALNHVWESGAPDARLARAVLAPFGWAFGAAVAIRNLAYDRAWLPQHALALPAIAVGNLTVGGTGKTPVSAWLVIGGSTSHSQQKFSMNWEGSSTASHSTPLMPAAPR